MEDMESKVHLLQANQDIEGEYTTFSFLMGKQVVSTITPQTGSMTKFLVFIILCLLSSNTFLLFHHTKLEDKKSSENSLAFSRYARLKYDTPLIYYNHTDYMSNNDTLQDEMWDSIDTSPLVVALDDEWATEHQLPLSVFRFPWDPEAKGIYFLKAFHGLHCLKVLRRAFIDYERGGDIGSSAGHVHHCLDALRQDMMCNADDTPMPMHDFPNKIGHEQVRMCRNFDQLIQWTKEPERHACYHRWSDYKGRVKIEWRFLLFVKKNRSTTERCNNTSKSLAISPPLGMTTRTFLLGTRVNSTLTNAKIRYACMHL
ncbi:uncharacterized protein EAE97_009342 [Botrytis byssoidea]|uniref:Uncharacterized protein n=1 Tax=Botrytis byssoidea TaxID=139641 RepID=A0A9P5LWJ3_9HELO|nr:uncharacterized protein EAE97_009342 [Botrytis byssoidea]KAF7931133.1 hypothetical protein EAE97_009342 [Botrytis byssoidea]